jgi:hypothetical protein
VTAWVSAANSVESGGPRCTDFSLRRGHTRNVGKRGPGASALDKCSYQALRSGIGSSGGRRIVGGRCLEGSAWVVGSGAGAQRSRSAAIRGSGDRRRGLFSTPPGPATHPVRAAPRRRRLGPDTASADAGAGGTNHRPPTAGWCLHPRLPYRQVAAGLGTSVIVSAGDVSYETPRLAEAYHKISTSLPVGGRGGRRTFLQHSRMTESRLAVEIPRELRRLPAQNLAGHLVT